MTLIYLAVRLPHKLGYVLIALCACGALSLLFVLPYDEQRLWGKFLGTKLVPAVIILAWVFWPSKHKGDRKEFVLSLKKVVIWGWVIYILFVAGFAFYRAQ